MDKTPEVPSDPQDLRCRVSQEMQDLTCLLSSGGRAGPCRLPEVPFGLWRRSPCGPSWGGCSRPPDTAENIRKQLLPPGLPSIPSPSREPNQGAHVLCPSPLNPLSGPSLPQGPNPQAPAQWGDSPCALERSHCPRSQEGSSSAICAILGFSAEVVLMGISLPSLFLLPPPSSPALQPPFSTLLI